MSYLTAVLFSFSVAIAAIAGWIRFSRIGPAFHPFILMMTLATMNEIASFIVIRSGLSNAVNANCYSFMEALLILWQFRRWGMFYRQEQFFMMIASVLAVVWIFENFIFSSITIFNSYFNIVYGFLVVMMSISMINRLIIRYGARLQTHSTFLICICFTIYYTYSALIEIYWIWGLGASRNFRLEIFRILGYINLITNLIYALAIIWIPRKRKFIVLS